MKTLNAFPPTMIRMEVDFYELRQYVKDLFEEEYGPNIVADVEAAQYSPYMINVTVYVTKKKEEMRDLCKVIGDVLRNHGVRAGVRTELVAE